MNQPQFNLYFTIYNFIGSNNSTYTSTDSQFFQIPVGINPPWFYIELKYDQNPSLSSFNYITWKLFDSQSNILIFHQGNIFVFF